MVNGVNDMTIHERVSALADGQLQGEEFLDAVDALGARDDLRAQWQTYHLVGDVLRAGRHLPCSDTGRFVARLQQRLGDEPALPRAETSMLPLPQRMEAANQPVFRWKLVAGVASLAAVAAIGWNLMGGAGIIVPSAGTELAQQSLGQGDRGVNSLLAADASSFRAPAPTRVMVGSERGAAPQIMLRDARLDELLEAHHQAGGASQMPSGFLRNATFEGPSR